MLNAASNGKPLEAQNGTYPCRECSKVFNRQERLVAHMAAHRPHRCSFPGCGKEFKFKAHLARHCAQAHGIHIQAGSPRPIVKTRAAFYLHTNQATKIARATCTSLFRSRHSARKPFIMINSVAIKAECMYFEQSCLDRIYITFAMQLFSFFVGQQKFSDGTTPVLPKCKPVDRGSVVSVSHKLGTPLMECPEWLKTTPKGEIPEPERLAFTPPPRSEGLF